MEVENNSVPVSYGAIGTPTNAAFTTVKEALANGNVDPEMWKMALTKYTAIGHAVGAFVIVFVGVAVLVKLFGKRKSFKDALPCIPFILFVVAVFDIVYLLIAFFIGPELVSLVAALVTLAVSIFSARAGFLQPKEVWKFEDSETWNKDWLSTTKVPDPKISDMNLVRALTPYLIVIIILVGTRVCQTFGFGWANAMKALTIGTGKSGLILGKDWNWAVLWCPGVAFIAVSLLSILILGMNGEETKNAWKDTGKQVYGAVIALLFGVAMVNIFRYSPDTVREYSMLSTMAHGLADLVGRAYVVIAPVIGVLGAFMSGSNTVSNTLFSSLQFEAAGCGKNRTRRLLKEENYENFE